MAPAECCAKRSVEHSPLSSLLTLCGNHRAKRNPEQIGQSPALAIPWSSSVTAPSCEVPCYLGGAARGIRLPKEFALHASPPSIEKLAASPRRPKLSRRSSGRTCRSIASSDDRHIPTSSACRITWDYRLPDRVSQARKGLDCIGLASTGGTSIVPCELGSCPLNCYDYHG
jgi:hypothetical protein